MKKHHRTHRRPLTAFWGGTLLAFLVLFGNRGRAQTIPNPSFEADVFVNAPGYCSANGSAITGWTVPEPSGTGLNPAGGSAPFADNGQTPQGANVAFIQTAGTTNTLATTITGLTPGTKYVVTCRVNSRVGLPPMIAYATPTMGLAVNGGAAQPFVVPAVAAMGINTTPYRLATVTFVATNTTAALSVSSTTATDGALLLDDFNITALPASLWSVSAWTDDASTGVDATHTLRAYRFGSATAASINGLSFTGVDGVNPSVVGSFAVTGMVGVYANTTNLLTAMGGSGSAELAKHFIFGGNPGTLTLSNLVAGTTYRLSLFGVGFEPQGNRNVVCSGGGDLLNVDEDRSGSGDGVRVDYTFVADATNNVVTLTPFNSANTFHLFGFALTRMSPVITARPADVVAFPGGPAQLTVSATSPAPLFCQWHSVSNGIISGATNTVLAWSSLAASDAGGYFAVVSNAFGSATSSVASVTVLASGLTNQTTRLATTVFWDASTLTNSGPFLYQWQHNGTNLPDGIITTVAGNGSVSFSGDGEPATNAALSGPRRATVDRSGNLFIADYYNNRVRKVDVHGTITTVVGNGTYGVPTNGAVATNTSFSYPIGVAVDGSGNLFVSRFDRVCKVGTNGLITTVAGNGTEGFSGDGGQATNAALSTPRGLAVDAAGNLFIADLYNNRIRKVDTSGVITTVAGNDSTSFSGDGGWAINAPLSHPSSVVVDGSGNLFVADSDHMRIRKVDTSGRITTVAGNGGYIYAGDGVQATDAHLNFPSAVAVDADGSLFISDTDNNRVRKVGSNGLISTVAGNGTGGYSGDGGPATNATLRLNTGGTIQSDVSVDGAGNLFITDTDNLRIRKVGNTTRPVLRLDNVTTNDMGSYQLVLTSPTTGLSITSAVVTLSQAFPTRPILGNLAFTGGNVGFTLSGDPGQTVVVETCTNLAAPDWVPVQTNTLGSSPAEFSTPAPLQQPSRFYRLRSP